MNRSTVVRCALPFVVTLFGCDGESDGAPPVDPAPVPLTACDELPPLWDCTDEFDPVVKPLWDALREADYAALPPIIQEMEFAYDERVGTATPEFLRARALANLWVLAESRREQSAPREQLEFS